MNENRTNTNTAPTAIPCLIRLRRAAARACGLWAILGPTLRLAKSVCTPMKMKVSKPITIRVTMS